MKRLMLLHTIFFVSLGVYSQQQYVINSSYLNEPDTVLIFTPSDYSESKSVPLTYLLHGWSGKYWHWDYMIDCQKYADNYNTIIVCPDGLYDSWYLNSPVKNENQFENFFFQDLVSLVDGNYNVNMDSIFITGLSMGGHGALYLSSKMPDYFTSAGSLSGLLDLREWEKHYGISRILGLDTVDRKEELLFDYSVISNIDKVILSDNPIIVSCGTEDPFYGLNLEFIEYCNSKGIPNVFIESEGAHNAAYWRSRIVDHFEFFFGENK